MIESIELTCGPTPKADPIKWTESPGVTIFVGPNNSCKSALLQEISESFTSERRSNRSALKTLEISAFNQAMFDDHPQFQDLQDDEKILLGNQNFSKEDWLRQFFSNWNYNGQGFRASRYIWMGGQNRLSMLPQELGADILRPMGPLARLHVNDKDRTVFQDAVFSGLKIYPVIDNLTSYGTFELAFSREKPNPSTERSTNDDQRTFLKRSLREREVSDGCKAYTGILGALYSGPYKVVLIDEPEAFLHPPLARALGKQIAEQARARNIYVATHSADFLMGAVESGVPVRIVRLQYQDGVATACMLDSDDLKQFMTDPLLRSANVLSGLFAQSVVVTEADTDRAFYQEINTRLLTEGKGRGIENAVFLNAQNKQTVPRIVGLLRKMGVPAAGIVDLDVVAEGRTPWVNQMEGIGVPSALRLPFESLRKTTFDHLKNASTNPDKKGYKTEGGTALLSGQNKEAADSLFSQLATCGLFVVPNGEVEAWLSTLDIPRSKHSWLRQIFGKMGSDPTSPDYIHPAHGDVWDFIAACNAWLTNPTRKGMIPPQ